VAINNTLIVGDIGINNFGTKYECLGYSGYRKVQIRFLDKFKLVKEIDSWEFRRGMVVNPYDPKVYGVGFIGEGAYSNTTHKDARSRWSRMLDRCYSGKEKFQTYAGCEVAEEWFNFQNFAEWYESEVEILRSNGIQYALDKDLLSGTLRGKLYSPASCCILPAVLNVGISTDLHSGVILRGNNYWTINSRYSKRINSGPFSTYDIAHAKYIELRQNIFLEYLDEFGPYLKSEVLVKLQEFYKQFLKGD